MSRKWKVRKKEVAPSGAKRYWFEDGQGNEAFLLVWPDGTTADPQVNGMRRLSPKVRAEILEAVNNYEVGRV